MNDQTAKQDEQRFNPIRIAKEGAESIGERLLFIDLRRALVIGSIAAVFIFLSTFATGYIGNAKALSLLQSILPTTRFMSSAILGAGATILALMLTLLSFTAGAEKKLAAFYYQRISQIALLSTILIIASMLLLLLLNVPLEESEAFYTWYTILYYFIVTYSALLGGATVTTVFMLYKAVITLILVVNPHVDTPDQLLETEDEEKVKEAEESR